MKEIKALTGIRGVAALMVVVYHYMDGGKSIQFGPLRNAVQHGYMAVDLFFVLSGFVMNYTYGSRFFDRTPFIDTYKSFLISRFARVYPLFLFMTLVCLILIYIGAPPLHMPEHPLPVIIGNLLMIQSWGIGPTLCGPGWSVSAELAAYVLFPVLLWLMSGSWRKCAVTILATLVSYVVLVLCWTPEDRNGLLDIDASDGSAVLRCLAGFVLGLFAFRLSRMRRIEAVLNAAITGNLASLVCLGCLAIAHSDLLIIAILPLLVASLSTARSATSSLLSSPIPTWLGLISYSIYLVHFPVNVLRPILHPYLGSWERYHISGILLTIVSVALATLTYYFIEYPARKWLRRASGASPVPSENPSVVSA